MTKDKIKIDEKYLKKFNEMWNIKCKNYEKLPSILPATRRILAIGDIHGDLNVLIKLLDRGGVINNMKQWIGGDTVIVQVGDQIDSCRSDTYNNCHNTEQPNDKGEDIDILRFMTKLHREAVRFNGAVYSLIGNHELMNGDNTRPADLRYVSYNNITSFADKNADDPYESGLINRKKDFSPGNKIANFLACTRQMAIIIGSNLFVHAGVVKEISEKYTIKDLNVLLALYLFDELDDPTYFSDVFDNPQISPLWNRAFGISKQSTNKKVCANLLSSTFKHWKVGKMWIGHTPQINTNYEGLCDGKLNQIDFGLSTAFSNYKSTSDPNNDAKLIEILNDNIVNVLQ